MTNREYLNEKLKAFHISEAQILDIAIYGNMPLEEEYVNSRETGKAIAMGIGELMLAPKMDGINENGFSVKFDFSNLGKYYQWLCRRWGLTPDPEVLEASGITMLRDLTDRW